MRFFRARSLILSPSNKSIARQALPPRPALKSLSGSGRLAPWAKVSFTLSLWAFPTAMIPSRDHTGLPIHFHSSMISRSASRMLLRMLANVLPRQSVSFAINWSINVEEDSAGTGFFMCSSNSRTYSSRAQRNPQPSQVEGSSGFESSSESMDGCLMRRTSRRRPCMHTVLHRRQVAVREFSCDLELFLCGQAHHGPSGIFWIHRRGGVQFLVGGVARGFYVGLEIGVLFGRQSLAGVELLLHLVRHDAQAQPLGRVGATADLLSRRLSVGLLRRSPLFVHLLQGLGVRAGKRAHGNGCDVGGRPDVVLQFLFIARLAGLVSAWRVARHATIFFLAGKIVFLHEAVVHGIDGGLFIVVQSEKITLRVLRVGCLVGLRGFDLAKGTDFSDPDLALVGRERGGFVELGLQTGAN